MLLFILVNVVFIALFLFVKEYIEDAFFEDLVKKRSIDSSDEGPPFKMFIYIQMLSYMTPLLFSIAIKTTQRLVETEAERKEAANFKHRSELQHLHYKFQPHFFFNSLNNIYAWVDISQEQAKTSIHSLSKLMRYMLYETIEDISNLITNAGFRISDYCSVRKKGKTSFVRKIWVCEKNR